MVVISHDEGQGLVDIGKEQAPKAFPGGPGIGEDE